MIISYKKYSSLLSVISLILLASIGLIGLTGCNINSSQTITDTGSTSPDNTGSASTYSDTAISTTITYDDQLEVEESIKAFGKAIENGDYNTAEEYCTPDFKDYMINLTSEKGAVTDTFSMAFLGICQ
ncbi:MAG: hypothetical protein A4E53_02976 [Pelotomaculum sp. PtaB.Bin104]|nr:MAG: hypothetical protein A4E53_02976 [Pelotomaculum sp. PtaB.Bin104]